MYMNRAEVEGVVNGMRDRGFPCDVLSIDPYWMGKAPWCTYEFDETVFPKPEEMIQNLQDQNVRTRLWITPYVPKGLPIYQELLDMGIATFKTAFAEQSPIEAVYHDGRTGLEMHNIYPMLYNKAEVDASS
jgi:alpha-D-xyloside xylohydrolase